MWARINRLFRKRFTRSEHENSRPPESFHKTSSLKETAKPESSHQIDSPLETFYKRLLKTDLKGFNSFAVQSRSLTIRDVYASVASQGRHNYAALLVEIDYLLYKGQRETPLFEYANYDAHILGSLASLVLDTAQNDLDTQSGLQVYRFLIAKYGDEALTSRQKMQFVEALAELDWYSELAEFNERFNIDTLAPLQTQLMNIDRLAKERNNEHQWLVALNAVYESLGMSQLELFDDQNLPLLDRLTSSTSKKIDGPLVSVIIPTHSPGSGLRTAIRSLLQQTWSNIEIIVVDDGSPGEYNQLLSDIAKSDSSIRVVRMENNLGAYVARNVGLAEATGEFVTTHDDDDWSHPDKIAMQISILIDDQSVKATTSGHIRTTQDMRFRRVNSRPQHLQPNYSSLLFRRSLIAQIGGWDTVNRGGDSELMSRVSLNFGSSSLVHKSNYPLSFSRVWPGSLTSGEMYRGYFGYSRLLYRWSYQQWHRAQMKNNNSVVFREDQPRPYVVPSTFEPGARRMDLGVLDVIYVSDFAREAKFVDAVLHEIESALDAGLRVGYMQVNSPQSVKRSTVVPRLFELQFSGGLIQVSEADQAKAKLLIVYDASIGMFLDQFRSNVIVSQAIVVEDRGIRLKGAEERTPSNPRQVLEHLDSSFCSNFRIVGGTHRDHESLSSVLPPRRLLDKRFVWKTHILDEPGVIRPPSSIPVVGFHSFGNKYRWPSYKSTFETIYCSGDYDFLFYGITRPAAQKYGKELVDKLARMDSDKRSLQEFFDAIDFWVYFPNERLEDRPWRPVLEALRSGTVVILPPWLEDVYGPAALYSSPEGVASLVAEYTRDEEKYFMQARVGQDFIASGFDQGAFVSRLKELLLCSNR